MLFPSADRPPLGSSNWLRQHAITIGTAIVVIVLLVQTLHRTASEWQQVYVEAGRQFIAGRDLAAKGDPAMVAFALEWLTGLYGADIKKAVKRTHATQWNKEPWALGAFSSAAPGGQPSRMALAEPFRDRLWFAGEAVHETLWGTVGGAWASGDRAATQALRKIGAVPEPPPEPQVTGGRRRR